MIIDCEEEKRQYARNLYNNLFFKKKETKGVNMHAKNI